MSDEIKDLSLVIACYQEGEHLECSFRRLISTLDSFTYSYEIIFVEDCSQDNTREIIEGFKTQYNQIKITTLFNEVNKGRGYTVTRGMKQAVGTVVGFIDIDLEVSPIYIADCVRAILEDRADMTSGCRHYNFSILKIHRYVMTKGYQFLARNILELPIEDTESGYKFFQREKIIPVLDRCIDPGWFWDTEIVMEASAASLRLMEIDCLFKKKDDKTSTVNMCSDSFKHFKCLLKYRKRQIK